MLEELASVCTACDRDLGDASFMLSMDTGAGRRRAYECPCGAVTVTVTRGR